jgi:formylglycine-generating enzyme required for sulfatase activity
MKFFRKDKDLPKVEPVKIKPLFGLKPGLWLTCAYALALALAIFLICFLPDIIHGSKRVTFTSDAGTVAVYVDGTYEGGTPFTRKIASGSHNVSYKINGEEIDNFTIKVGHPVFLNWLFPRKQSVHSSAPLTDKAFEALSKEFLEDVSRYSAILEYDSVHRYPDLYTSYINSIMAYPSYKSHIEAFEASLLFVTTDEMFEDAQNAIGIIGLDAVIPYQILDKNSTFGEEADRPVVGAKKAVLDAGSFTIEGFTIAEADFVNGKSVKDSYPEVLEAGLETHTDSFNIGSYCITEYQYSQFVQENPSWSVSNKAELKAKGLVDDYYLDGVTISASVTGIRPVRNISYYAAQAFCKWLSEKTGKNVYLPSEDQWIAASLSDPEEDYQRSLAPSEAQGAPSAMLGGVWEMTDTDLIPLSRVIKGHTVENARKVLRSYDTQCDIVVKGGSYVNAVGSIDRYSVGSAYRSLCSDFMGFRIAWD